MPTMLDTSPVRNQIDEARACHEQGLACAGQRRFEEARALFQEAIRLKPDYAIAYNNLGNVLYSQGQYEQAVASYRQALAHNCGFAQAYYNLATTLLAMERFEEVLANCRKALQIRPHCAATYNTMGLAYAGLGNFTEAVACHERALAITPEYPEARNNLGTALHRLNRLDEAVAQYTEALRQQPDYGPAYNNLGAVFLKRANGREAVPLLEQAVRLLPNHADTHFNLGYALPDQGQLEEAAHCFHEALRIRPDHAEAHMGLAFIYLLQGDFENGWSEYEWRWRLERLPSRNLHRPRWDGTPLDGRTILLHAEQGLGDTIQFIRYARIVKHYGGTVIVEAPRCLVPLLRSCPSIDRLVAAGDALPAYDCEAPLLSVPGIVKTTLATIPADIPYLAADPGLERQWQGELNSYSGYKIGIAWQGNVQHERDRVRSIPLIQFAPLARTESVVLFSLQKGPGREQIQSLAKQLAVIDLGDRIDEEAGAFLDTAAIMKNLDLVITSDTAVAHLAGALGVPVWLALCFMPEWRWLLDREDSPWYPSMRLFRQSEPGDWPGVFNRMAEQLSQHVMRTPTRRSAWIEIGPGELLDRLTILQIKIERIPVEATRARLRAEHAALLALRNREIPEAQAIVELTAELKSVNERLWQIEEDIRHCERAQDFGPRFIELARSVYQHNDRRYLLKRRINVLLGSAKAEEKSYEVTTGE